MSFRILSSFCLRQLSVSAAKVKIVPGSCRLISSIPVSRALVDVSPRWTVATNLQLCRYKSKKPKKGKKQEEDEEEEEVEEESGESIDALPGEKEQILKLSQVRVDKLMKMAVHSSRLVDDAFLEGRLYKNESKLLKKASSVQEGDILDVELGPDPKNPDFIKVHRVEITEIKEGVHSYVKILLSKNLTIKRPTS